MSLKPIREYFTQQILLADGTLKEHSDAFNTENIPGNLMGKAFHVLCNGVDQGRSDMMTTNDEVPVEVKLFFKAGKETIPALNEAQDLANTVRLKCLIIKAFKQVPGIRSIQCTGFKPTPITSNDNKFSISINFTVQTGFGLAG